MRGPYRARSRCLQQMHREMDDASDHRQRCRDKKRIRRYTLLARHHERRQVSHQ